MSWRLAGSLVKLRDQVNAKYPNRSKASDGTIGDAAHAAVASDHNENSAGVVCALDITHSPQTGFDAHALADRLLANRHPNLKYLISNKRIAGDWTGWRWVYYGGSNPHTSHIHISVGRGDDGRSQPPYDDTHEWAVGEAAPQPSPIAPAPARTQTGTVHLPASVDSWALYKVGSGYRKGTTDQIGTLRPSKFGGLTYKIVEHRGNVVVIDTQNFGRGAIWVQGTEAIFGGSPSVAPRAPSRGTVTFPASVATWAVYKVGSAYRKGTSDQVGTILPSRYGGLTYPIVQNLGNVVVIDTQSFGRVAAWIKNTEAIIR